MLIRGASGSGKSRLALALIEAERTGLLRFARLVGDDRVHLEAVHGRALVRPAPALAGLIEVRGMGIRKLPHEPLALVGLVVDLGAHDAERLPGTEFPGAIFTEICGVRLSRIAVASSHDALSMVVAALGPAGH